MNQVIEIPDTPDRLVATKHNKDRIKKPMPTKISIICNGIKRIISCPTSCESPILTYFRKTKPTIDDRHDKGKALANSEVQTSTHKLNGHVQSEEGVLPLANSPAIVSSDGSGKSSKVENIPKNGPTFDSGKGDFLDENNMQPCTISNVYRRRKVVQNECVSPLNMVAVTCENDSVMKEVTSGSGTVASDGESSIVDIKDLVAEDVDSRRHEGKGISSHFSSEEANAGSSHLSQRERVHKDPAESNTDFDEDANGWRTTHNQWKQRDINQQKIETVQSDHNKGIDIIDLNDSPIASSPMRDIPNADELGINRQTESSTSRSLGKRPISCIEDSVGQPSTSISKRKQRDIKQQKIEMIQNAHNNGIEIIDLDDSPVASSPVRDIPHAVELGVDKQTESSTSRKRGKRPISYIEDSSSPVRDIPHARELGIDRQVESSTSRRRCKCPISYREDSVGEPSIPRSKRSKTLRRPRLIRNQNLSVPSTSSPVSEPKNLSGPSTSSPVSEPNIQIHGNDEDLSARARQMEEDEFFAQQLQQQLYNEELEERNMLAMEAAASDIVRNNLLQVNRDFNENDYEMLLALDEDNYKHQGATSFQINRLPVSAVQTENSQECLICLEKPTIGEKIRHLPCLHSFHKDCVDEWLSRRTSCPVCKTSVDAIG